MQELLIIDSWIRPGEGSNEGSLDLEEFVASLPAEFLSEFDEGGTAELVDELLHVRPVCLLVQRQSELCVLFALEGRLLLAVVAMQTENNLHWNWLRISPSSIGINMQKKEFFLSKLKTYFFFLLIFSYKFRG